MFDMTKVKTKVVDKTTFMDCCEYIYASLPKSTVVGSITDAEQNNIPIEYGVIYYDDTTICGITMAFIVDRCSMANIFAFILPEYRGTGIGRESFKQGCEYLSNKYKDYDYTLLITDPPSDTNVTLKSVENYDLLENVRSGNINLFRVKKENLS